MDSQKPKMTKFKIGLCQLSVTSDKNTNLARACTSINIAANRGATLVVLPMHMFDVDIPGDIVFKESDTFTAGDEPSIVKTHMGCIGIGICHDIRFPELAMLYRSQGAQLICYPGAFNMSTGEALWEIEQRARAADNQLYVATCSPSRESVGDYMIWGHSTVVGPTGEIIASSGHEETVVIAEIDYSAIPLERSRHPLQKQKREDIYQFVSSMQANNL